ncbi:MAG: NifB/NifX family molybdenum-iron cluster-binding protein [Bacteroidales bacterium]
MKVAVPARQNQIDDHFGHCEVFKIYSIDDNNTIMGSEDVPSPDGCGCKSDIATVLAQKGVTTMLAGNMGQGAVNVLTAQGINVIRGCSGNIEEVVNSFIKGEISDSGEGCKAHESHSHDGHTCSH